MNSINIEIERIKKKFFIQRLQNEIMTLEQTNPRYTYLKNIYDELMNSKKGLESMFDETSNDVYTKKWNRIPNYHKIQKLKEYLTNKYPSEVERNKIELLLLKKINDGTLNSCKYVLYDTKTFQITKIMLSKNEVY